MNPASSKVLRYAPPQVSGQVVYQSCSRDPDGEVQPESSGKDNAVMRVVRGDELEAEMETELLKAAEVVCLPPTTVRPMLNYYQWDIEKMLENTKYGENFRHLIDIGLIILPQKEELSMCTSPRQIISGTGSACLRCKRRVDTSIVTNCKHNFCVSCFQKYLVSEIKIGDRSTFKCPFVLCSMMLPDDIVLEYLLPHFKPHFKKLCIDDFVNRSKYLRKCPAIGCNLYSWVNVDSLLKKQQSFTCQCGCSYCFGCGSELHYPLDCSQLKKWIQLFKTLPKFEDIVIYKPYRKPCPFCQQPNEANKCLSGLPWARKVTCDSCNFMFCWSCLGQVEWTKQHVCTDSTVRKFNIEIEPLRQIFLDYDELETRFGLFADFAEKVNIDESSKKASVRLETPSILSDEVLSRVPKYQALLAHAYVFVFFLEPTVNKFHLIKALLKFEEELRIMRKAMEENNHEYGGTNDVDSCYLKALSILEEGFENELWYFRQPDFEL